MKIQFPVSSTVFLIVAQKSTHSLRTNLGAWGSVGAIFSPETGPLVDTSQALKSAGIRIDQDLPVGKPLGFEPKAIVTVPQVDEHGDRRKITTSHLNTKPVSSGDSFTTDNPAGFQDEDKDQSTCNGSLGPAECLICLGLVSLKDPFVHRCPLCPKVFHSQCIDPWFQDQSTCPACRQTVPGKGVMIPNPTLDPRYDFFDIIAPDHSQVQNSLEIYAGCVCEIIITLFGLLMGGILYIGSFGGCFFRLYQAISHAPIKGGIYSSLTFLGYTHKWWSVLLLV
ncbi:hypothetical protein PSHT_12928 [Puccinia striiformis]|uniref:RING-type domain-containing protein n=1 Tax=Puccinia striiformis TaxID=27350 RepID=A0A2S4UTL2_9BASI|nr:hypothetical protein PSHT_12928 [Puccinia striiformis]